MAIRNKYNHLLYQGIQQISTATGTSGGTSTSTVTLSGNQTITGNKIFEGNVTFSSNVSFTDGFSSTGTVIISGSATIPNISYDNSTSGLSATAVKTAIDEIDINRTYLTAGTVSVPSYTDNLDGTVDIGQSTVRFYDNTSFTGKLKEYTVSSATITATNDLTKLTYIYADYNGGSPITTNSNNVNDLNGATTIPLFTLARHNNTICRLDWNSIGNGYSSKAFQKDTEINRFSIVEGLSLGETGTRNITVTEGKVWYGTKKVSLTAVDTSATGNITALVYHTTTGGWTCSTASSSYNNTQYDTNTGLTTLTANRYAVNWVYRDVDTTKKRVCVLLGSGDYTLADAESSTAPSPPASVVGLCKLLGRIIVQKNATAATTIQQITTTTFTGSQVTNHNDLNNIENVGSGVTYGHISTSAETLYGDKTFNNNIGIGTTSITSDSILDITSTTKGLLLPRMTTTQRTTITAPSTALIVYDTDIGAFFQGDGSTWIQGL